MRRWLAAAAVMVATAVAGAPAGAAVPGALDGRFGECGVGQVPGSVRGVFTVGSEVTAAGLIGIGYTADEAVTVRVGLDGQVDMSYGAGGVARAKLGGFAKPSYGFQGFALAPGGKLLLAGRAGEDAAQDSQAAVIRLNPDGSLDTTFGNGGLVNPLPGRKASIAGSVAVDTAGRIVVAGTRDSQFVVSRLSPDGAPDPGFGGGVTQLTFPGTKVGAAHSIRPLASGGVLVGGEADDAFAIARLRDDGTPDPAFGAGGLSVASPPAASFLSVLQPLPGGSFLAAGHADDVNRLDLVVGRYTADGKPDPSFGRGGFAFAPLVDDAKQIIVQPDGGFLVSGDGFARFTAGGALDPSFGKGGVFSSFSANQIAIAPDGSAVGVAPWRRSMEIERFALSGPALQTIADQNPVCGAAVTTKRVKELVRKDFDTPYGGVGVSLELLEPAQVTWSGTIKAGGRTYKLKKVREEFASAQPNETILPLTKATQARLKKAKKAHVVITARDTAGHRTQLSADLKP